MRIFTLRMAGVMQHQELPRGNSVGAMKTAGLAKVVTSPLSLSAQTNVLGMGSAKWGSANATKVGLAWTVQLEQKATMKMVPLVSNEPVHF